VTFSSISAPAAPKSIPNYAKESKLICSLPVASSTVKVPAAYVISLAASSLFLRTVFAPKVILPLFSARLPISVNRL